MAIRILRGPPTYVDLLSTYFWLIFQSDELEFDEFFFQTEKFW